MKLVAAALLVLGSTVASAKTPTAVTEYRLHSWNCEPDWCYALVPDVNPRPSEAEILSRPGALRGEAILAEIAELPPGTGVTWHVPLVETRQAYPPKDTVARIRSASGKSGLRFYGPEGPLEEAGDSAVADRKAGWGEKVYYLDHRWVALPDFEIRYLRTGSQGSQPPWAVFSEFELRHGDERRTIKTDPNFGAWTPTAIEFAGRKYVLEVGTSELLRIGMIHGDLYAWTAEEHAARQRKLYGN